MKKRHIFQKIDTLVIKIGTRVLTGEDNLVLRDRIDCLAAEVVKLERQGIKSVLVSSGAVGAGIGKLGLSSYPRIITDRQAAASVGQVQLMKMWEHAFGMHGKLVGQVLVTTGDFQNRRRYVNLQNTFDSLIRLGVIPVVNENDSVAVRELKYGDNDKLSAHVASVVDAGMLVILTDTDGLYTANPHRDPDAERLSMVEKITPSILHATRGKGSEVSIGGMRSKIDSARLVTEAGRYCVIASGELCRLAGIIEGLDLGTLFLPSSAGMKRRKAWIAFTSRSRGSLIVDQGAREALLNRGSSLLSSGISEIEGRFNHGDVVDIVCKGEKEPFAKGVTSYSAEDLARIKGLHSSRIEEVLGCQGPGTVVHKDNLVLVNK